MVYVSVFLLRSFGLVLIFNLCSILNILLVLCLVMFPVKSWSWYDFGFDLSYVMVIVMVMLIKQVMCVVIVEVLVKVMIGLENVVRNS